MPRHSVRSVGIDTLARRARAGDRDAWLELAKRIRATAGIARFADGSRRALRRVGTPTAARLLAKLGLDA
jgi:hypothetical protein